MHEPWNQTATRSPPRRLADAVRNRRGRTRCRRQPPLARTSRTPSRTRQRPSGQPPRPPSRSEEHLHRQAPNTYLQTTRSSFEGESLHGDWRCRRRYRRFRRPCRELRPQPTAPAAESREGERDQASTATVIVATRRNEGQRLSYSPRQRSAPESRSPRGFAPSRDLYGVERAPGTGPIENRYPDESAASRRADHSTRRVALQIPQSPAMSPPLRRPRPQAPKRPCPFR